MKKAALIAAILAFSTAPVMAQTAPQSGAAASGQSGAAGAGAGVTCASGTLASWPDAVGTPLTGHRR